MLRVPATAFLRCQEESGRHDDKLSEAHPSSAVPPMYWSTRVTTQVRKASERGTRNTCLASLQELDIFIPYVPTVFVLADVIESKLVSLPYSIASIRPGVHLSVTGQIRAMNNSGTPLT
jgi:hypothetical protein